MAIAKKDPNLVRQGEVSVFVYRQDDLADTPTFTGQFGYSIVDGLTKSFGDLTAIVEKDPTRPNAFNIVSKSRGAPELGEISILEHVRRYTLGLIERISRLLCDHVFLIKIATCDSDRPDTLDEWASVFVVVGSQITELDAGTLQARDNSEPIEITGTFMHEDFERLFTVRLGEVADSIILTEVLDVIWADQLSCGTCATFSDGCTENYALTDNNTGSPGLSSQLVGTTDGSTYTTYDIVTLGGAAANAINAVGNYIVAVSATDEAHHYAPKSNLAPGQWIRVATGYQAGGGPTCIFALSPQQVYMGGLGGYVYKSDDITSSVEVIHDASLTTEDANAIHARDNVILTGHDNNVLLLSTNGGDSFSALTGPVPASNVNAVYVRSQTQFFVGMSNGTHYYTVDSGVTWTQRNLPNQSNLTAVNDIMFSPDFPEIGAMAVQTATTSEIYRTISGGRTWYRNSPGIIQLGTLPTRFNSVALCGVDKIVAGGLNSGGTDGILVIGE